MDLTKWTLRVSGVEGCWVPRQGREGGGSGRERGKILKIICRRCRRREREKNTQIFRDANEMPLQCTCWQNLKLRYGWLASGRSTPKEV